MHSAELVLDIPVNIPYTVKDLFRVAVETIPVPVVTANLSFLSHGPTQPTLEQMTDRQYLEFYTGYCLAYKFAPFTCQNVRYRQKDEAPFLTYPESTIVTRFPAKWSDPIIAAQIAALLAKGGRADQVQVEMDGRSLSEFRRYLMREVMIGRYLSEAEIVLDQTYSGANSNERRLRAAFFAGHNYLVRGFSDYHQEDDGKLKVRSGLSLMLDTEVVDTSLGNTLTDWFNRLNTDFLKLPSSPASPN